MIAFKFRSTVYREQWTNIIINHTHENYMEVRTGTKQDLPQCTARVDNQLDQCLPAAWTTRDHHCHLTPYYNTCKTCAHCQVDLARCPL